MNTAVETGFFQAGDKVELIRGQLMVAEPQGSRHAATVSLVADALRAAFRSGQRTSSYTLEPGMAHVYNEGDLHSPRREGPTRRIRIEGKNMDTVRRLPYERA